ncbi:Type II secretory pathway ATPase PulE/Tfp pilus assembly pathway ATPase PilB [Geitlerinema sp. FC II]|nr:Type II secretory pathway ATPase PulE/Tfp pilus assembly pathway ATPase PilB [Geitlerinema sp. FC II]
MPQYDDEYILTEVYSAFEPFRPPDKDTYVDFESVRGRWNVSRELGRRITRSKMATCQLFSGHRGVGKTTELLRLKEELEAKKYHVVYFAADEQDIEPQDTEYADILLSCTRHLVQEIVIDGQNPVVRWLNDRWGEFKEFALSDIEFDKLTLQQKLGAFGQINANVRAVPQIRGQVRSEMNKHTVSLVQALNEFIEMAQTKLKGEGKKGIVVVADNLDRIVEVREEKGRSNHDQIYLDRSEQMSGINCHVIYTVPISFLCSDRATQIGNLYDRDVLPMVMVRNEDGSRNEAGMEKFRELVRRRVRKVDPKLAEVMDTEIFESAEVLDRLCYMSGGHLRILMQMVQKAIDWTDTLPISQQAVHSAISEMRKTYIDTIQADWWEALARVHQTKQIKKDDLHHLFLLNRCVLEYREMGEDGELKDWYDVHPTIEQIDKFKKILASPD